MSSCLLPLHYSCGLSPTSGVCVSEALVCSHLKPDRRRVCLSVCLSPCGMPKDSSVGGGKMFLPSFTAG